MDRMKILFQQTMMISFGILVGISVEGAWYRSEILFEWYHPLSILVTGFICSLISMILYTEREILQKQYRIRIILHFLLMFVAVMALGKVFRWYSQWDGAVFVALEYIFVYAFVWIATIWMGRNNQNSINSALDDIRDEE